MLYSIHVFFTDAMSKGELFFLNMDSKTAASSDQLTWSDAGSSSAWGDLSAYTPVAIPYKAPIDYAKYGTAAGVALIVLSGIRFFLPVLRSRWAWAAGTVITSLVMTSGFMFVRIRGMPASGANGQWIAPGYQNQYGQEVQVVSFTCAYMRCYHTHSGN